jgi:hypothetical protein
VQRQHLHADRCAVALRGLYGYLGARNVKADTGPASPRARATWSDGRSDPEWDAFAEGISGGDLVQSTAWATAKMGLGLTTALVVVHGETGACIGGGLLIVRRLVAGLAVGYVARGPLAHPDTPWASSVALSALLERARALRVRYLIVQPPEGSDLEGELGRRGFLAAAPNVAPVATIRLDLTRPDDELLDNMSDMRRRNIRKALREDVDVTTSSDVALFARLHAATAERQDFTPLSLAYLEQHWRALCPSDHVSILVARHADNPVAALWLTRFNGIVTFRLAGWNASAPAPKHVNDALHWSAIQWARANGAHAYDFGGFDRGAAERLIDGLPLADDFTRSPSFFKLGFGRPPLLLPQSRYLIPNRLARNAIEKTGLLEGSRGLRFADRFRSG